jgi:acetyltransferase-like isoleucine patch superfamily enzyme
LRRDHAPFWLKRTMAAGSALWTKHFLVPQLESVGPGLIVINPRHVEVNGSDVRLGSHVHMMATRDRPIRLTVFPQPGGIIDIGDYTIILPGSRIASARSIRVGKNCMFATNSYVSDADWHDVYDRTAAPGSIAPIVIEDNVWVGDSAIVCKGVTIGRNSVIGAGAIVTRDVPANVIAVGNPAKVVKELDPDRPMRTREALFNGERPYDDYIVSFERWVLAPNTFGAWLRAKIAPTRDS